MLSLFPQLFFLSPLSATLLRIAVALTFAFIAWQQFKRQDELAKFRFPVVGSGVWIVWLSIVIEVALAMMLFIGLYTQAIAVLAAIASLKYAVWSARLPLFSPISRGTALLLFVITMTLIVTGAGPFAFDLPL
jgi:uncharacterized membrane protein YphA (DoxX/SURF4 family)